MRRGPALLLEKSRHRALPAEKDVILQQPEIIDQRVDFFLERPVGHGHALLGEKQMPLDDPIPAFDAAQKTGVKGMRDAGRLQYEERQQ